MSRSSHYILRVSCPDRPGVVATVAQTLFDQGFNIEDAAQFNDPLSDNFFMRVVTRPVKDTTPLSDLETAFESLTEPFEMSWSFHDAGEKPKILIMVSKEDHCLHDLLYRVRTDHLPVTITGVVSNHEDCRALAEHDNLPFYFLPVDANAKADQEDQLADIIDHTRTELVVLARYMQILTEDMCNRYNGRIINIHHSFLPGFKGARPYHQAYERGVKLIGATAHFATPDLDEGPIIEQETARVDHSMGPDHFKKIGRDIECRVLARAVQYYAERRIFLKGQHTVIL